MKLVSLVVPERVGLWHPTPQFDLDPPAGRVQGPGTLMSMADHVKEGYAMIQGVWNEVPVQTQR